MTYCSSNVLSFVASFPAQDELGSFCTYSQVRLLVAQCLTVMGNDLFLMNNSVNDWHYILTNN